MKSVEKPSWYSSLLMPKEYDTIILDGLSVSDAHSLICEKHGEEFKISSGNIAIELPRKFDMNVVKLRYEWYNKRYQDGDKSETVVSALSFLNTILNGDNNGQ